MFEFGFALFVAYALVRVAQIWQEIFGGEVRDTPAITAINCFHIMERDRKMRELQETQRKQEQQIRELERKMHEQADAALKHNEHLRQVEMEIQRQRDDKTSRDLKAAEMRAEKAEADLLAGIRPDKYPTAEELQIIRRRYEYNEQNVHFAVVGSSGTGKSSLINALRGLEACSAQAARTGTVETTTIVTRYADPRAGRQGRLWWYDVPGGGTLTVPGADYFNSLGLYIFDAILVVSAARFTELDIAILQHAKKWDIPAYVVRSKADQDVRSRVKGRIGAQAYRKEASRQPAMEEERVALIREIHANVKENLALEKMEAVECFVVSESAMLRCALKMETVAVDSDRDSLREPDEDNDLVTDPEDLDFEEKKLLEKLVLTTIQKRVVEKSASWLENVVKRGFRAVRR